VPSVTSRSKAYRFQLEFRLRDQPLIHQVVLEPADFNRAIEATFFDALRQGHFTTYAPPAAEEALIVPHFSARAENTPRVSGFEVVITTPAGGEHGKEFDLGFFRNLGTRTAVELAAQGKVPDDATVLYHLAAYPDEYEQASPSGFDFELESPTVEVPIQGRSLQDLGERQAWDHPGPEDFRVLIPRQVIHDAVEEAQRAPEREVGGVLLGHLRRDEGSGELFLEVTCLVPAVETAATGTSVTFTHETWAQAREVARYRGEGEIFVGWVHSHPFRFCEECPLRQEGAAMDKAARDKVGWTGPEECLGKVLFYSGDDEFLMELSFARPFMVGLLAAVEPNVERFLGHLPVKLFGWRNGRIEARGFEVIDG
jgi:proteasome lid subunit RPN8/RPN11